MSIRENHNSHNATQQRNTRSKPVSGERSILHSHVSIARDIFAVCCVISESTHSYFHNMSKIYDPEIPGKIIAMLPTAHAISVLHIVSELVVSGSCVAMTHIPIQTSARGRYLKR